jgi:microcystin-dependent protein
MSRLAEVIPAGIFWPYGGSAAPPGILPCNGAAVDRTQYARLFAAIGTTWGPGNGTTTFNVPNVAAGTVLVAAGTGFALAASGGASSVQVTLTEAQMPSHTHEVSGNTGKGTQHKHEHTVPHRHGGIPSHGTVLVQAGAGVVVAAADPAIVLSNVDGAYSHTNEDDHTHPGSGLDVDDTGGDDPFTVPVMQPWRAANIGITT